MKKLFFTIITSVIMVSLMAQVNYECGTDYYDSIEVVNDPSITQKRLELEKFTKNYLQQTSKSGDTIVIPMVFHVLHQYGEERISIEKIEYGIEQVNKDYNSDNTELNSIVSAFKDIIGDAKFVFRLAKIDPDGNCTSGVVYYDTKLTYKASNSLKYTIKSWDSQSYLNIWTVSSIESGAAAWSHYPGVSSTLDGVVSIYRYITSGHTLGHEIGHYLNLAHPWGSTNEPGLSSNCDIDDGVEDTPLTSGADQNCNLSQVSCGSLDNIQNFMDYSTCDAMFTNGQTDRMRAALNSTVGGRKSLWTDENLNETGTNNGYLPTICEPVADFMGNVSGICASETIQFQDFSYNSDVTTWSWSFEGGTPSVSSEKNPLITYSTPGLYPVSLTVSNSAGSSTLTRNNLVFVTDTLKGIIAPVIVDMEDSEFPNYESDIYKSWSFEKDGSFGWAVHNSDNKSMRIYNNGNDEGVVNSMITSNINLSEVENPDYLYFDYAYAQRNSSSDEELKVFVSTDCGKKWILKTFIGGKSLVTSNSEYVVDEFKPAYDEWKQEKIDITRYKSNDYIQVKFQVESNNGNYLYIDNLNVGKTVSIASNRVYENNLKVFPNPTNGEINIKYNLNQNQKVNIQITNILGENVFIKDISGITGENIQTINLNSLNIPKGIYLIMVYNDNIAYSKRIVVQ